MKKRTKVLLIIIGLVLLVGFIRIPGYDCFYNISSPTDDWLLDYRIDKSFLFFSLELWYKQEGNTLKYTWSNSCEPNPENLPEFNSDDKLKGIGLSIGFLPGKIKNDIPEFFINIIPWWYSSIGFEVYSTWQDETLQLTNETFCYYAIRYDNPSNFQTHGDELKFFNTLEDCEN